VPNNVGSVFSIKGLLSNDLKSRDNVYITTARERAMRSRVSRFFGYVVCAMQSYNYPHERSTLISFLRIISVLTQSTYTIHELERYSKRANENEEKKKRKQTKRAYSIAQRILYTQNTQNEALHY